MTDIEQDRRQWIEQGQALVRSLAGEIHRKLPPYVVLDDLIEYGQVGLAEAARDFDPARGSPFSTYAYHRVRGAIYDGMAQMAWFSRSQYRRLHDTRHVQQAGETAEEALVDEAAPAPPMTAIHRETAQRLDALIETLPPQEHSLIRATYFEGLTLQEAGHRLGVGKAWASRLRARVLERLRRGLETEDRGDDNLSGLKHLSERSV